GSGGILGGLGQMLDPLGIFANKSGGAEGAAGGDALNKLLDPLGIFPMIKGEIDKTQGNPGDSIKTAQMFMNAFGANSVQKTDPAQPGPDSSGGETDPAK